MFVNPPNERTAEGESCEPLDGVGRGRCIRRDSRNGQLLLCNSPYATNLVKQIRNFIIKIIQVQRKKIKLVDEDTQRWVAQPDMGLRKRLEKESILRNNTEGSTIKRLVSRYPQTMPEQAMLRRNLMG